MSPYGSSRRNGSRTGIFLLMYEMLGFVGGLEEIPKGTLGAVGLMISVHLGLIPSLSEEGKLLLSPVSVMRGGEYWRLLTGPILHGEEIHLYYNMISLLWKGKSLERGRGALGFLSLLLFLTLGSSLTFIGVSYLAAEVSQDPQYVNARAVGFSAVLFALRVLEGRGNPAALGTWAELVLIQMAVPDASFLGHLSGILFGTLYVYSPLYSSTLTPSRFLRRCPFTLLTLMGLIGHRFGVFSPFLKSTGLREFIYSTLWRSPRCIDARIPDWSVLLTAPFLHPDDFHSILWGVSVLLKVKTLENIRGSRKAFTSFITSVLGTSTSYFGFCWIIRRYGLLYPIIVEECVVGLSGPTCALKVITIHVLISEGHYNGLFFLAFEMLETFLLYEDEQNLMYHFCGLLVGTLFCVMTSFRRKYRVFPGEGIKLNSYSSSISEVRRSKGTRSWGYGDLTPDKIVRRRNKNLIDVSSAAEEEEIDETILEESRRHHEDWVLRQRRSETPSPSAPPWELFDDPQTLDPLLERSYPPPPYLEPVNYEDALSPSDNDILLTAELKDLIELRRRRVEKYS